MSTKYVKLFEELDNDGDFNQIKPDETGANKPPTLRRGQKAALERGDDILSDAQYAACYVLAQRIIERGEDTQGRGDTGLTRAALKLNKDTTENWQDVSAAKLSVYLDLKPTTVSRTVTKFKKIILGDRENSESENIWPGLLELADRFKEMTNSALVALAEEAISGNLDFSKYEDYLDTQGGSQKKARENKQERDKIIRRMIRDVFTSAYRATKDGTKSAKLAKSTVSNKHEITPEEVIQLAKEEFKKEPNLFKIWASADVKTGTSSLKPKESQA